MCKVWQGEGCRRVLLFERGGCVAEGGWNDCCRPGNVKWFVWNEGGAILRHVTSLQVRSVLLKFLRCCFSGLIANFHIALSVSVGVPAANVARGVVETYRRYSAADNFRSGGRWPQN